ncbi:MAG: hypothetical protein WC459_01950 [Patescibacteria group bacterium]
MLFLIIAGLVYASASALVLTGPGSFNFIKFVGAVGFCAGTILVGAALGITCLDYLANVKMAKQKKMDKMGVIYVNPKCRSQVIRIMVRREADRQFFN